MTKPDFICIGTQKAATSWLYNILMENPGVFLSPIKELRFFDRILLPEEHRVVGERKKKALTRRLKEAKALKDRGLRRAKVEYLKSIAQDERLTPEWYERIFDTPLAADKPRGEITPNYIDMPEENIRYMHSFLNGQTKLILTIRAPKDRQASQYRMHMKRHGVPTTGEEWLHLYKQMRHREDFGNYSRGIPLFRKYFGNDAILILPFGWVKSKPLEVIRKVEAHIGAPHYENYTQLKEVHHQSIKVDIPDWLIDRIEQNTRAEKEYLISEFGQEFYEQTI